MKHRGYSRPCQRAIVDFGADVPFGQVPGKMKEHYGIEIPVSAVRTITEGHAHEIWQKQEEGQVKGKRPKKQIIAQSDGCLIPIVETRKSTLKKKRDRRKGKTLKYREARLSLAYEQGSRELVYKGTFQSVDKAGQQWLECVQAVGRDRYTQIHGVGDGAPWIARQMEEHFGAKGTYLLDFYHVCEYLCAAAEAIEKRKKGPPKEEWIEQQKELLKRSQAKQVLWNLKSWLENRSVERAEAPIRTCYRYLKNRLHQLDYQRALQHDLPIGSGEVESAHRYVIQQRLKVAGGWWLITHAEHMLALRVCRANRQWENYWKNKDMSL